GEALQGATPFAVTGIPAFDEQLGGFPRGRLSELVGHGSSGKLTLVLSALQQVVAPSGNQSGHEQSGNEPAGAAALVDLSGSVFPSEPWAAGRLLVVRPVSAERALRALDALAASAAFALVALESSGAGPRRL